VVDAVATADVRGSTRPLGWAEPPPSIGISKSRIEVFIEILAEVSREEMTVTN
jgi:hypothetical protein